jgi:hypothetical protein
MVQKVTYQRAKISHHEMPAEKLPSLSRRGLLLRVSMVSLGGPGLPLGNHEAHGIVQNG